MLSAKRLNKRIKRCVAQVHHLMGKEQTFIGEANCVYIKLHLNLQGVRCCKVMQIHAVDSYEYKIKIKLN